MNYKFSTGQQVRIKIPPLNKPDWKGKIVTVSNRLPHPPFTKNRPGNWYEIEVVGHVGKSPWAHEGALEPIPDERGSWEEIEKITDWNPTKEKVCVKVP